MNQRTTTTAEYGSWVNYGTGGTTVEDCVTEAAGNIPGLVDAYRAAINEALPPGVTLNGDLFIGPWPIRTGTTRAIAAAVAGVDFWALVERYDNAGTAA